MNLAKEIEGSMMTYKGVIDTSRDEFSWGYYDSLIRGMVNGDVYCLRDYVNSLFDRFGNLIRTEVTLDATIVKCNDKVTLWFSDSIERDHWENNLHHYRVDEVILMSPPMSSINGIPLDSKEREYFNCKNTIKALDEQVFRPLFNSNQHPTQERSLTQEESNILSEVWNKIQIMFNYKG